MEMEIAQQNYTTHQQQSGHSGVEKCGLLVSSRILGWQQTQTAWYTTPVIPLSCWDLCRLRIDIVARHMTLSEVCGGQWQPVAVEHDRERGPEVV